MKEKYLEINKTADLEKNYFNDLRKTFNGKIEVNRIIKRILNKYEGIKIENLYKFFSEDGILDIIILNILKSDIKIIISGINDIYIKKIYGVTFNNCVFNLSINYKDLEISGNIKHPTYKKDLVFKKCNFKKDLTFSDCTFKGKLRIIDTEIKGKLELNSIKDLNFLQIGGTTTTKDIKTKDIKTKDIEIKEIVFEKVYITEDKGLFILHNIIKCKFTYKYSSVIPKNIKLTNNKFTEILFIDIDLGKTTFNGVQIKKLYLENATLNDCIFNGVEFPKKYELEKGKLSNKQLKDNYRQLKHVMDSNGNYTEANKFYEKEMEYELLRLGVDKSFFKGFFTLFKNKLTGEKAQNLGSRIQLWFGYQFNEFGNNWIRAIYGLLILAFISVLINILYNHFINITILNYHIFGGGLTISDLFEFDSIKYYFKLFLNLLYPLYGLKKDYIDGLDIWLTLGFIIYKTIYGILLWHLVVALKRTTKR